MARRNLQCEDGIDEKRWAKIMGAKPVSEAARQRRQAKERADAIIALGWEPEDGTAEGRYAATTGEMLKWIAEKVQG